MYLFGRPAGAYGFKAAGIGNAEQKLGIVVVSCNRCAAACLGEVVKPEGQQAVFFQGGVFQPVYA